MRASKHNKLWRDSARGFTLVEVLMSVLILSIGLLGLGAVLPVVVNQQRQSSERTFSTLANSAIDGLLFTDRVGADARFRLTFAVERDANGIVPLGQSVLLRIGNQSVTLVMPTNAGAIAAAVAAVPEFAGVLVSGSDPVIDGVNNRQDYSFDLIFTGPLGGAVIPVNSVTATGQGGSVSNMQNRRILAGVATAGAELWGNWGMQTTGVASDLIPGAVTESDAGLWLIPEPDQADVATIQLGVRQPASATVPVTLDRRVALPLLDRVYPTVDSGMSGPQFVWDVAVRRLSPGASRTVQVATFLRRIDPKTRIPANQSLWQVYMGRGVTPEEEKWPVSVDAAGRATFDGRRGTGALYSRPIAVPVVFNDATIDGRQPRDRFQIEATPTQFLSVQPGVTIDAAGLFAIAAQPGQQLVDNLGNIYTVVGVDDRVNNAVLNRWIRVTPPVPAGIRPTSAADERTIRQVLMTPQVPARVILTTVNP